MGKKTAIAIKFGEKIKQLRIDRNITQEGLAYLSALDRSYVGSIERGERNISLLNIEKLAVGLGVEIKEIFD
jgi:transcriptional regulator with XRE-family HTH domain